MTAYIVTIDGAAQVLDEDQAHDAVAEFFAQAENLRDGSDISIRKADYMTRIHTDYDAAVTYINDTKDQQERRRRKAQVFQVIYGGPLGNPGLPVGNPGSPTGRLTVHHPNLGY